MELKEALETIVDECKDGYAIAYAKAALELGDHNHHFISTSNNSPVMNIVHVPTKKMMIGEELRVQLLYVLNNLSYWRGEKAREVKKILKEASKSV